jgi:hypothetical protein
MKKLIMFVIVLAISAPALADDLNPPDWALGPGTIYGIWGFPSADSGQEGDYPEVGEMVSHATHPDPWELTDTSDPDEVAHQYMGIVYTSGVTWLASHEGREGVVTDGGMSFGAYNFPGEGTKLIRLQVTWTGTETTMFFFGAEGGTYGKWDEWIVLRDDAWIETVDLGDGWSHSTYEFLIEANPDWEEFYVGYTGGDPSYIDQIVIDTICYPGAEPPDGPGREEIPSPIVIDPNVMTVYETGGTEGDFGVSLANEPEPGETVTVTVDPNEASNDITLIGADMDDTITLIFDEFDWDQPQTIAFKAIDDAIPDVPELLERQRILISSVYSGPIQDPNWVGEKIVTVNVYDNDQPNILFTVTPANLETPKTPILPFPETAVQLWEEEAPAGLRWRKIGITLQMAPTGGPVKLQAEITGDNLPLTDPCLPYEEADDPNGLTFTAVTDQLWNSETMTSGWNVSQDIKIWGNDDAELQVLGEEGEHPSAEGDQNYEATLSVWVIDDGGDVGYTDLEQSVEFDIQDNECGAFGVLAMDVGNPNAFTDPNYRDEDGNPLPDCYVDIYDVIEFTTQWLNCSDPQDPACESYL